MDQAVRPRGQGEVLTLSFDIGGTHLKAGILSPSGTLVAGPVHVDTPHPAPPAAVVDLLAGLASQLGRFDRISIGFPGVVRKSTVLTAPNLGTEAWRGFDLGGELQKRLNAPVRMANDATVQGLGVIARKGLECVITLGTGMGFALYEDGRPAPHLELSQHPVRGDKTYDAYIGNIAYKKAGKKRWNKRVERAIGFIATLTNYDMLYIGGGNSRNVQLKLPPTVQLTSNEAGITGGIRLWDKQLDSVFADT